MFRNLEMCEELGKMKITYISHSGFSVELEETILLFDYWKGELPEWDRRKRLLAFASHKHQDHFSLSVFQLAGSFEKFHYVLGNDIKLSANYLLKKGLDPALLSRTSRLHPDETRDFSGIQVRTLPSTDAGLAFVVKAEGKSFYHAGDLNWWYWEGEPEAWLQAMEHDYKKQIDKLAGEHFDAAFVPLDPRLGEKGYRLGMDYFLARVQADRVFPMHMWGEYGWIGRYLEETGRREGQIQRICREGQEFLWNT